ncbi:MAG: tyrosine-type recombinase/integrase [Acidobacteria bacterium]|nr:tyrosine-type recombinase/integrase [Acidobacteriota bacterium]
MRRRPASRGPCRSRRGCGPFWIFVASDRTAASSRRTPTSSGTRWASASRTAGRRGGRRAGARASRGLTFHDLRHEFASAMLDAGVPAHKVRDWVGHKSLTTTNIYANTTLATCGTPARRSRAGGTRMRSKLTGN